MLLALESFETADPARSQREDRTQSALYREGFDAGRAAAQDALAADQARLKASLVQEIADMSFGFAEAQAHVTSQMSELMAAVLQVILPAAMTVSLRAQLSELLTEALAADAAAPVTLTVNPDQFESVTAALAQLDHPFLRVSTDPNLTTHAAITSLVSGETHLDLDRALALISDVFSNLPASEERKQS